MRKRLVGGVFALMMAMSPLVATAQATFFDPETRATVQRLVKQVAAQVMPGLALPEGEARTQLPAVPTVEPSTPERASEPTREPDDEPVVNLEVDLTDLVEYTNQGVKMKAPAAWNVELSEHESAVFYVEIPESGVFIGLQANTSLEIPSLIGMAFFRSQTEVVLQDFGDAETFESTTLFTSQDLPMAKLAFSGVSMGEAQAGVIYTISPSERVFALIASGPPDQWEQVAEGVQLMAESIVFDEELITLLTAGDDAVLLTDSDGTIEVEVPAGWYALDVDDPVFQIVLSEPEVRFAVAVATAEDFSEDFDPSMLEELVPSNSELTPEDQETLIDGVIDVLRNSGGDVEMNEEQSTIVTREGAITVRAEGVADLGDGVIIPVKFHVDLRATDGVVVAVFGDLEAASGIEAEIQALVESVTGL